MKNFENIITIGVVAFSLIFYLIISLVTVYAIVSTIIVFKQDVLDKRVKRR